MLVWSLTVLIEPIVYFSALYLLYVILMKNDMPFNFKALLFLLYLPSLILTPTHFNLSEFDLSTCLATEGPLALYYTYIIEGVLMIMIIAISAWAFFWSKKWEDRNRILIISTGICLFLLAFSWGNIIGSFTDNWQLGEYGLFGMPIFIAFLVYSIVKYQLFNIKLISSVALVVALSALNFSLLFVQSVDVFRTIALSTFIISIIFGGLLIKSVKNEIQQREKIEKLAIELEKANTQLKELDKQKDELLGIVSHQLATPVSSMKWYLEMLNDGDIGPISNEQKEHVKSMMGVASNLSDLVGMILDVSRIQLGRMHIEKQELNLDSFYKEIIEIIEPKAKEKKVNLVVKMPATFPAAMLDKRYTHMTIENLLSNAVKYTPENGSVEFTVSIKGNMMTVTVKDTGVGIPKTEQDKIFGKMFRASNVRNTVDGNGFGLYVAKGAVEAQGGKISFSSTEGKGTTFTVQLPLK